MKSIKFLFVTLFLLLFAVEAYSQTYSFSVERAVIYDKQTRSTMQKTDISMILYLYDTYLETSSGLIFRQVSDIKYLNKNAFQYYAKDDENKRCLITFSAVNVIEWIISIEYSNLIVTYYVVLRL